MGRKRRLGVYARKRALADAVVASEVADGDVTALIDELDEANAAAEVAREMATSPIRPITPEEIDRREYDAIIRELERDQRQQSRAELERLNAISREEARRVEAVAAQRRHAAELAQASRERFTIQAQERQAAADQQRLQQLEQWARSRQAADQQHQQQEIAAAKQQRVAAAHTNLMQAFDAILRPAELPPQPAEPYQGSPHFGSPDFSPDAAIARFQPWKP